MDGDDCCCYGCPKCCGCAQMKRESNGDTYCCCCPLKLGLYFIEFLILYLLVKFTFDAIFLFFNEYYDSSYPAILLLCTVPLYASVFLFCCFFDAPTKSKRRLAFWAVIIAIFAVICYTVWHIIYITSIYERKYVY